MSSSNQVSFPGKTVFFTFFFKYILSTFSPLVVATAANKASLAKSRGCMRTRSVNTEILFNLSSSSNITESLQRFGVGDEDKEVLVVGVNNTLEDVREVVTGEWVGLDRLGSFLDKNALTKLHKLKPEELEDLTGSLCSRIAAKDAL